MPKPYTPNDKWAQRAKQDGFRARSVYKLIELDERFNLIKPGMKIIDIGAAPGSWLQYSAHVTGSSGRVLGMDLKPIEFVADNVITAVGDVFDKELLAGQIQALGWTKADLILSDIAPNTSGIKSVDQWRSIELNRGVIEISRTWLRPGGKVVLKVFRGEDFDEFLRELKEEFPEVRMRSVAASRDRSREVYLVCRKK